jgi:1-acyl-sn-glycerol-3-phosphate acyltransferase
MPFLQTENSLTPQDIASLTERALTVSPPRAAFDRAAKVIEFYFSPTVVGLENLGEKPTLFVGNHALFGFDAWIFVLSMYRHTGRFVRGLGDRLFFESPVGEALMKYGLVLGHPAVCSALMTAGEDLLVYPGGSAESTKREEKKYSLMWGERYGFVRMAAENGYDITPFGLVGPDDCYDRLLEGEDLLDTWPGRLAGRLGLTEGLRRDILPPIPLGVFASPLPKPQPCFLALGERVTVPDYRGKTVPAEVLRDVRTQTAERIDQAIREMLLLRAQREGQMSWWRRQLLR